MEEKAATVNADLTEKKPEKELLRPIIVESRENAVLRVSLTILAFLLVGSAIGMSLWQINSLEQKKQDLSNAVGLKQQQYEAINKETDKLREQRADLLVQISALKETLKLQVVGTQDQFVDDLQRVLNAPGKDDHSKLKATVALIDELKKSYQENQPDIVKGTPPNSPVPLIKFVNLRIPRIDTDAANKLPEVNAFLYDTFKNQEIKVKDNQRSDKPPSVTEIRYVHYPEDKQGAEFLMKTLKTRFNIEKARISYVPLENNPGTALGAFEVSFARGALKPTPAENH